MKYVEESGTDTHSVGYTYDNINNLTALVETINGVERKTSYTYDEDNRPTSISTNGTSRSYTYDQLGRVSADVTKQGDTELFDRTYVYKAPAVGGVSNVLSRLSYSGTNWERSFMVNRDANGNIHYALEGTYINTYEYDSANQLIRENHSITGTTTIWTYDSAGNILTREVYPRCSGTPDPATRISVVNYTYGDSDWGDLLTAYNGVEITHDNIGNPLNDGTWTYTWQHGRQLASMTKIDQSESWQFTYNVDGMRTKRTDGTTTYNYTYLGGQLTSMTVDGHTLYFAYDAAGTPMGMTYDGTNYYYVTTIQGDVVSILNASGIEVVRYIYDAWGNPISTTGTLATTIGFYNPLRYRGYVYDTETELYYLQSRYYSPEMGRFINADGFASTGQGVLGNNMFAYCLNNPINFVDRDGKNAEPAIWVSTMWWLCGVDGLAPIGEGIYIGGIVVLGIISLSMTVVESIESNFVSSKSKSNYDPDPYARPNQKKQNRENKNKNRKKDNFHPRNNRRDGKPAPPKHHTPGRDHRKFSQPGKTKMDMLYKQIG